MKEPEKIQNLIYYIRNQRVMLDIDLATLYQVENRVLIQSVKRNIERFPDDFMFQVSDQEMTILIDHIENVNTKTQVNQDITILRSQFVISRSHGGRRTNPYAFTELGISMLSSILNSRQAIQVNIEIMRTFVKIKQYSSNYKDLANKIVQLERNYDGQFKIVFDAIKELVKAPDPNKRPIGFGKP